jgi:bifunctional non-homologous end joining protein LigD
MRPKYACPCADRGRLTVAAQIAALKLHPRNCEPGHPDQPGRFVFDLEPAPDVPFVRVIAAALEMRDRLMALGLVSFCKTTGSKGLHVVTAVAIALGLGWLFGRMHRPLWASPKS